MVHISDVIRAWMTHAGVASESELARRSGVSQSSVNRLMRGEASDPRTSSLTAIARALGTSPTALTSRQLPGPTTTSSEIPQGRAGRVPLLDWSDVRDTRAAIARAQQWLDAPRAASPSAYYLRVVTDAMVSAGFPTFPPGVLILVDPEVEPGNGDYVVAITPEGVTFKQLVIEPPDRLLKALNPNYTPMAVSDGVAIKAVVTELRAGVRQGKK